jgi:hypothetical protein
MNRTEDCAGHFGCEWFMSQLASLWRFDGSSSLCQVSKSLRLMTLGVG